MHDMQANQQQLSGLRKGAVVALPAAIVTCSLFMAMQHLVKVDDFSPPEMVVYDIEAYAEPTDPDPERRPTTVKPKPLDAIVPPPQPPKLLNSVDNPKLPPSDYAGAAPADYGQGNITRLQPVNISSIPMRNLQPLTPPVPVYPSRSAADGREGQCEVYFSVSPQGQPFDVRADCTHRDFIRAAESAVKKVRFAPKIHLGRALTVTGVVYPIEFKMEQ